MQQFSAAPAISPPIVDAWSGRACCLGAVLAISFAMAELSAQPVTSRRDSLQWLSVEADAIVRGQRRPLVGRISMDAVAVDVTEDPGVGYEDEFVLLGSQGDECISATVLARARNTIPWEVLSSMAPRLERVYYPPAGTTHPGRTTGITGARHAADMVGERVRERGPIPQP